MLLFMKLLKFGKKCHKVSGCQPIRMYRRLKSEPWGECCNFVPSKLNIGRNLGNKIGLNVSGSLLKSFVKRCQELYLITWIIKICTHCRPIVLLAWARSAMRVKGYELEMSHNYSFLTDKYYFPFSLAVMGISLCRTLLSLMKVLN